MNRLGATGATAPSGEGERSIAQSISVSANTSHFVIVAATRSLYVGSRPAEEIGLQSPCRRDGATARRAQRVPDKRPVPILIPQPDLRPPAVDPKASAPCRARGDCFRRQFQRPRTTYTLKNHTKQLIKRVDAECGIFNDDTLIAIGRMTSKNMSSQGETYDYINSDKGPMTDVKCEFTGAE
jgi:hypothetical protein